MKFQKSDLSKGRMFMNRKKLFLKFISLFLIIIITVNFNAGCNSDIQPGKGEGDECNFYYPNGHILISENPFLLLYMNPEGLEGYLEVDGKIEHFYLIELYTSETACTVALTKEYKPHDTWPYEKNENVFMFCTLVHKTNHELVSVIDPETQGSSGEEFILKAANIPKRDVARKFKEFKNQSKQEILNYFEAH